MLECYLQESLNHKVSAEVCRGRLDCAVRELQSIMLVGTKRPTVVGIL